MTREQVAQLLSIIEATYPSFRPQDKRAMLDAWAIQLVNDDYNAVLNGLVAYNRSNRTAFAPSIGQLLGHTEDVIQERELADFALRNYEESQARIAAKDRLLIK